jgi:hypothetical protein
MSCCCRFPRLYKNTQPGEIITAGFLFKGSTLEDVSVRFHRGYEFRFVIPAEIQPYPESYACLHVKGIPFQNSASLMMFPLRRKARRNPDNLFLSRLQGGIAKEKSYAQRTRVVICFYLTERISTFQSIAASMQ